MPFNPVQGLPHGRRTLDLAGLSAGLAQALACGRYIRLQPAYHAKKPYAGFALWQAHPGARGPRRWPGPSARALPPHPPAARPPCAPAPSGLQAATQRQQCPAPLLQADPMPGQHSRNLRLTHVMHDGA